jgi:serine/threonine-protein kinase
VENPLSHTRFECEIQALATLRNPHIVKMLGHGRAADGTRYYIMEHLPGMTLEDLVEQDGPLAPERVIHLLRQVCAALAEVHHRGFVHRDVKPSNIFCCQRRGQQDVVTLIDFGLVQRSLLALPHEGTHEHHDYPQAGERSDGPGGTVKLTQKGTVLGSPLYMSPEQAACRGPVDGRSDLYSLGVVGYFVHGPWADQLREACAEAKSRSRQVYLDLAKVTFVDEAGTRLLRSLIDQGPTLTGCSSFVAELLKK